MTCIYVCICVLCIYCFFPPYSSIDPTATAADAVGYDYYADDQAPTTELPGKQCPIPSPRYHLSIYIYLCTRHCCCYVTFLFNCIACFVVP